MSQWVSPPAPLPSSWWIRDSVGVSSCSLFLPPGGSETVWVSPPAPSSFLLVDQRQCGYLLLLPLPSSWWIRDSVGVSSCSLFLPPGGSETVWVSPSARSSFLLVDQRQCGGQDKIMQLKSTFAHMIFIILFCFRITVKWLSPVTMSTAQLTLLIGLGSICHIFVG